MTYTISVPLKNAYYNYIFTIIKILHFMSKYLFQLDFLKSCQYYSLYNTISRYLPNINRPTNISIFFHAKSARLET